MNYKGPSCLVPSHIYKKINPLHSALSQSQSEVQSLRNQIARMEFTSSGSHSRRDKGKGKAKETNYTPEGNPLQHNPLPAPPTAVPMERYATIGGDVRSSSVEAELYAAAMEASILEHRGRDGYSSDVGPSGSVAGPSRSRDNSHGHVASGLVGAAQGTSGSEIIGYSQHYAESSAQSYPSKPRSRKSSRPDALPLALDTAVSQAQQHASRSSPSRRTRIVPGASNEGDRIYVPPGSSQWPHPGSQNTYVNGYASASVPPVPSSAPVEDSHRKHRRHRLKPRREERPGRDSSRIVGVTGLGLIDENLEERRRNDPQAAFVDGYREGLNNGLGYASSRTSATPAPMAPASGARVRFTASAESISPPGSVPPTTSNQHRPQVSRRNTVQTITPDGLADRLRDLMEDPNHHNTRASIAPSETPTWGTVSESSRRQSGASDVLATLRSFPAHAHQPSRSSISSNEIPVGDPSAFLPAIPVNRGPSQNLTSDRDAFPLSSAPATAPASFPPSTEASRPARRSNDHQVNHSARATSAARPVNSRLASFPANSASVNDTRHTRHAYDNRPQPLHMASMSFPSANGNYTPYPSGSAYPNHNPLPTLPNFGGFPSSLGSAPPRPLLHEYNSAPVVPNVAPSRTSNHNSTTPVARNPSTGGNILGLELGNDEEDRSGYEPIPAFAAPTPRASHGLFLRSFSFDGHEGDGTLYR